ncbi:hypothetical protein Scep_018550 [Stephania cephalantha]|uniref:Uncharacterized protein n=1 Tax=Stephania cephalantha TaxID=152367 RepID=A0AAP0IA31_9MAGN
MAANQRRMTRTRGRDGAAWGTMTRSREQRRTSGAASKNGGDDGEAARGSKRRARGGAARRGNDVEQRRAVARCRDRLIPDETQQQRDIGL